MKYLGVFAFLLALYWSWSLSPDVDEVSLETHTVIQEQMVDLITQTVSVLRPNSIEIQFDKIWTEPISSTRLKATFKYKILNQDQEGYEDSETISGTAFLKLQEDDSWLVDQVETSDAMIEFQTGTRITPSSF